MKLLFNNNLSHKLVTRLEDLFPGSSHVMLDDLDESEDIDIWSFAMENGFTIITKDSDCSDLTIYHGYPPKIVWPRVGNCRLSDIERIIRDHFERINQFVNDPDVGIFEVG